MSKMGRVFLALMLSVTLCFTMPMTAFANEAEGSQETTVSDQGNDGNVVVEEKQDQTTPVEGTEEDSVANDEGKTLEAQSSEDPATGDETPAVEGEAAGGVATIDGTSYASLADAVAAVATNNEETVIKLLKDTTGSGVIVKEGQNIVFDLNGHTYSVGTPTVGSAGTETSGFQLLKGSKVTFKNGAVASVTGKDYLPYGGILIQNYCDLTLDNVVLDTSKNKAITYVVSNNFGSLLVKNNTVIKAAEGKQAFDLWYGMSEVYNDGINVTFDESFTGTVTGNVEYGADNRGASVENWTEKAKLVIKAGTFNVTFADSNAKDGVALKDSNIEITGGTFSSDPSDFVDSEVYHAVESDGKFVVEKHKFVFKDGREATCDEDGYTSSVTCSCGKVLQSEQPIPKKGHKYEVIPAQKASFDADGHDASGIKCASCGKVFQEPQKTESRLDTVELSETQYTYDGTAHSPEVTVKDVDGNVINPENYAVTYINNTNAGTASAVVRMNDNVYTGEKSAEFEIAPIKPATVRLSSTSFIYNGGANKPGVVALDAAGKTISTAYYKVSKSSNGASVGTHAYTVTFVGNYTGVQKLSFTVVPKNPTQTTPANAKKAFTAKWKKTSSANATGYQVRYSTKSSMSDAKRVTVKGYAKTSKEISGLKAKKKYYVQVRSYKTVGGDNYYSSWSSKKSVKTK